MRLESATHGSKSVERRVNRDDSQRRIEVASFDQRVREEHVELSESVPRTLVSSAPDDRQEAVIFFEREPARCSYAPKFGPTDPSGPFGSQRPRVSSSG